MNYLITGISGQDGRILALNLQHQGHQVYGVTRQLSSLESNLGQNITPNVSQNNIFYLSEDFSNFKNLIDFCSDMKIDIIVNFWGLSSVGESFSKPLIAMQSNFEFTLKLLEMIRLKMPDIKLINSASSEMFGIRDNTSDEITDLRPLSPYALSKAYSFDVVKYYRNHYDCFASNAIFFNHESPLRRDQFVTKKIVTTAYDISVGSSQFLTLGNINIWRDWGWAPDYMNGVLQLSKHHEPDDFVFATGEARSLYNFVDRVFAHFSIPIEDHLHSDVTLFRPTEIPWNCGNASKARNLLHWKPETDFETMIQNLCRAHEKSETSSDADYNYFLESLLII